MGLLNLKQHVSDAADLGGVLMQLRNALGLVITGITGTVAVALHLHPVALHEVLGLPPTFTALDHPFVIWWPLAFIGLAVTLRLTAGEMRALGKAATDRQRLSATQWEAAYNTSQADLRAVAADRDRIQAELTALHHAEAQRRHGT